MSSKRPKIYFVADNGIKIEMYGNRAVSNPIVLDIPRQKIASTMQLPIQMLFPTDAKRSTKNETV